MSQRVDPPPFASIWRTMCHYEKQNVLHRCTMYGQLTKRGTVCHFRRMAIEFIELLFLYWKTQHLSSKDPRSHSDIKILTLVKFQHPSNPKPEPPSGRSSDGYPAVFLRYQVFFPSSNLIRNFRLISRIISFFYRLRPSIISFPELCFRCSKAYKQALSCRSFAFNNVFLHR